MFWQIFLEFPQLWLNNAQGTHCSHREWNVQSPCHSIKVSFNIPKTCFSKAYLLELYCM
jgi:hypothetical protein